MDIKELKITAAKCRKHVVRMLRASGHGHVGGALSCKDIVTALYFYKMKVDEQRPADEDRDRFLLSAGHKCMVQYAVLAEKGYFPKDVLDTFGKLNSKIPGHPDMHKLPGIEANTGALGHGLPIAAGMAMGLRLDRSDAKVYTVLGDGELAEGSNWEAVSAAAHHRLENLVVIVDYNGLQISGRVEEVMNLTPIADRFEAFGWAAATIDGNRMEEIVEVLNRIPLVKGKPSVVVAHTVKCKGIPDGENQAAYHYWSPSPIELNNADIILDEEIQKYREVVL